MRRKFDRILFLFLLFTLTFSNMTFAAVGVEDEVSAYLIGDFETGEILEEYNIYKPVEIASITKLMSYLIVIEDVHKGIISLDDMIYIDQDTANIKGSSLELQEGESFTVEELLKGVLVVSANDATYALSKYIAGTEKAFVERMNEKAKDIGLESTVYFNSTGLPEGNLQNMMSPKDIFDLSRYIIDKYPEILSTTTIPYIEVPSRKYREENTNPLLNEIKGVDGLKTGFTNKAGYCLVSTIEVNGETTLDEDFRLIGIVMGTKSEGKRKELGKSVLQYGLDNYSKKILTNENIPIDIIYIPKSRDKEIEVYPERNFSTMAKNGDVLDVDITIDEGIELPLKEWDKIGKAVILKNDEVIGEMDLVVHQDVKKESLLKIITRNIREFLSFLFSKVMGDKRIG